MAMRIYDVCQYQGCQKSKQSAKMFRFPNAITQKDRQNQWIMHSGNNDLLTWSASSIRSAGLCSDHFAEDDVIQNKDGTLRLRAKAVPIDWRVDKGQIMEEESEPETAESGQMAQLCCMDHNASDVQKGRMDIDVSNQRESVGNSEAFSIPAYQNSVVSCSVENNGESFVVTKHMNDSSYPSKNNIFSNVDESESNEVYLSHEVDHDSNNIATDVMIDEVETQKHVNQRIQRNRFLKKKSTIRKFCSVKCEQKTRFIERRIKFLEQKVKHLTTVYRNVKQNNSRLKQRVDLEKAKRMTHINDFMTDLECSESCKTLVVMQFKPKNRQKFTLAEQNLCKIMYYHSAAGYSQLIKLGIRLAAESTVRSWIAQLDVKPGLNDNVLRKIEQKLSLLPTEERICSLKFDEMSLKKMEEYSPKYDEIEGLEDMGGNMRNAKVARYALLFCLDSINAKNPWRQLFCYGFNENGASAEQLHTLLRQMLSALFKIGALVKIIVCDQGSNNQSLFKKYLKVDVEQPYFEHEGKKIFAAFDWPHLIKRLIYQLRTHKYIFVHDKVIMSWKDVLDTYEVDKMNSSSNLLAFLSDRHFNPNNFESMKVKLAFQLLSRRMAAAMVTAGEAGKRGDKNGLVSDTWEQSAEFVKRLDTIIDACNSYRLRNVEKQKRPLSHLNPEIQKRLEEFVEWSKKWTTHPVRSGKRGKFETVGRPPCFIGLSLTANCLLQLFEHLKVELNNPEFELATGLCNQDSVEHCNSKCRGRGGFNPNPTCRMYRLTFRHIMSTDFIDTRQHGNVQTTESNSLINTKNTECGDENVDSLAAVANNLPDLEFAEIQELLHAAEMMETFLPVDSSKKVDFATKGMYERNAVTYLSGYTAKNALKNSKCPDCKKVFVKTVEEVVTVDEHYTKCREYTHTNESLSEVAYLTRPTDVFSKIIFCQLDAYEQHHASLWPQRKLIECLIDVVEKITNDEFPEWFEKSNPCYQHRIDALKFLLKVKIFNTTRQNNEKRRAEAKLVIKTSSRKMKILKNA